LEALFKPGVTGILKKKGALGELEGLLGFLPLFPGFPFLLSKKEGFQEDYFKEGIWDYS